MITSDDYTFMENPMSESWAIHIKTGQYEGVQYSYGKIGLKESLEHDSATLQFNYAVLDSCEHDTDELVASAEFNNYVGDILSHILTDSLENDRFKLGNNDRADANNGS